VLDVQLPGCSGLDLQQELAQGHAPMPIIFITGHGDIPMTVRAIKAGASDFLTKPFRDETAQRHRAGAAPRRPMASGQHPPAVETPGAADDRRRDSRFSEIVGHSAALRRVLQQVELVAPTDATSSSTARLHRQELLARALHHLSARHTHPLVTLTAPIPTGLLEASCSGMRRGRLPAP